MTKNELYEREIERIAPKLKELEGRPFDEIMNGLYNEVFHSSISRSLIFALTYVLDPSRFFIEIGHLFGGYIIEFTADTPLRGFGPFVYRNVRSGKRPTDKEARDFIKEFLEDNIRVEGLLKKAEEVVDTCKVIQGT